jgi:hypothetical protein
MSPHKVGLMNGTMVETNHSRPAVEWYNWEVNMGSSIINPHYKANKVSHNENHRS